MPRDRLTHLRGSHDPFFDLDAKDDWEASKIVQDKRHWPAMDFQRLGGPVFRSWPALRSDHRFTHASRPRARATIYIS